MSVEEKDVSNSVKNPQKFWFLLVFLFLIIGVVASIFYWNYTQSKRNIIETYVSSDVDQYFRMRFADWNEDIFHNMANNITMEKLAPCNKLMENMEEIAVASNAEKRLSTTFIKTKELEDEQIFSSCVESMDNIKWKQLGKDLYVLGDQNAIDSVDNIDENIMSKKELKSYMNKYDIINYMSYKNQESNILKTVDAYTLAEFDFFVWGIRGNNEEILMDMNIHHKGDKKISQDYEFTPESVDDFAKETTVFLLEAGPLFHLFDMKYEDFKKGVDVAINQSSPDFAALISEDDKKALYGIFENNFVVSIHEANNIYGFGLYISFGDDKTWELLKKVMPLIKAQLSLTKDAQGNPINVTQTDHKIIFSYDRFNLELSNEEGKVIGKLLDPMVEQGGDKTEYNNKTLASMYYNEKKMLDVLQNFNKIHSEDLTQLGLSSMISGLEGKEDIYGNLYTDDNVIRLEFIIK